jgi:hypothetical protein
MSARRISFLSILFAMLAVAFVVSLPRIVRAEEADATTDFGNSQYQAQGQINSNATYIHSGASEGDYPTAKLDKGAMVTVVGVKGDWLKIVPPEGSYCYVAKAWVEQHGDGTNRVGRVTNPLNVRIGSSLNAMKTKVAGRLDIGAEVNIVGEQDEYFKIAPPKDVFVYVNKQYVDLVGNVAKNTAVQPAAGDTQTAGAAGTSAVGQNDQTNQVNAQSNGLTDQSAQKPQQQNSSQPPVDVAASATTQPTGSVANAIAGATAPATQPSETEADAENQFDSLEKTYLEADKQPIDQQPLTDLQTGYAKLASSTVLPESLRRMCDYREATIKQRINDQQQFLAVKKSQDEMKQKELALQGEREELEARIKQTAIQCYTAVGTLRVSSLQEGHGTLYRLTDPNTGRTVVYVRSDDAKLGALEGQFIGINGAVQDDASLNMKTIAPTSFAAVDQSKVNLTVSSQIVPPSLMPSAPTASAGETPSESR